MLPVKCAQCNGREPYEVSFWFVHIWHLYGLQKGGYPFAANDLSTKEWLDMGELRTELEADKDRMLMNLIGLSASRR